MNRVTLRALARIVAGWLPSGAVPVEDTDAPSVGDEPGPAPDDRDGLRLGHVAGQDGH